MNKMFVSSVFLVRIKHATLNNKYDYQFKRGVIKSAALYFTTNAGGMSSALNKSIFKFISTGINDRKSRPLFPF